MAERAEPMIVGNDTNPTPPRCTARLYEGVLARHLPEGVVMIMGKGYVCTSD